MLHSRPPRDPPPFMANAILNFHFDYLTPSLWQKQDTNSDNDDKSGSSWWARWWVLSTYEREASCASWRWVEDGSMAPQQEVGEGITRERCGGKRKSVITPTINGGHIISFQICAFTLWQKTTGSTCSKSSQQSCWDERGPRSLRLFFPPQLSFLPLLQGQQLSKGAQEHRVHLSSLQPCYVNDWMKWG